MSLTREQFFKNSVWTFLELTLYPLLMIVGVRVFIQHLGIEQYGLWMLVTHITLGLSLLNIGVGDSNIRHIASYRATGENAMISRVFSYNLLFALLLCAAAALAGIAMFFTNFITLFCEPQNLPTANTILLLASISAGIRFIESATLSTFKAFERFDLSSKLNIVSKNSVVLINLLQVAFGKGLTDILYTTVIINASNVLIQLFVLNRYSPGIFRFPGASVLKERSHSLIYNFWYWLQSSIALAGFLADKLVVARLTDVKTLGYYSIASMIGANIHNFFLSFGGFIFPRVSYKLAHNRDLGPMYFISRSLIALPGWLLILFLMLAGDPLFKLWLGPETYAGSILFIKLYLVFEAGMLLIIAPFHFINGGSQLKLNSIFEITIRGTHFISMLAGYYFGGVNGIIWGLIFTTLINIPFQYYVFHKYVIRGIGNLQFATVIMPVLFMVAMLASDNIILRLSLALLFIIFSKLIYFDPARKYSAGNFLFRRPQ